MGRHLSNDMRDLKRNWVEKLMLNPNTRSKEFKSNAKTNGQDNSKAKIINREKSISMDLYHTN